MTIIRVVSLALMTLMILIALAFMEIISSGHGCRVDDPASCRPPGLPAPGSYSVTDHRGDIFGVPEVIVLGGQR